MHVRMGGAPHQNVALLSTHPNVEQELQIPVPEPRHQQEERLMPMMSAVQITTLKSEFYPRLHIRVV